MPHNKHTQSSVKQETHTAMKTTSEKFSENFSLPMLMNAITMHGSGILCDVETFCLLFDVQWGSDEYFEVFDDLEMLLEMPLEVTCYNDVVAYNAEAVYGAN